ncbi:class I SAM-dependent methyltransferase [Neobacillus rhizosphaerae]|uniref:class I SAM-dependent methyltransferase n=1 Tax=Neobacillus rhizosphaerae TaxID=2880965 RepID=UPI003D29FEAF
MFITTAGRTNQQMIEKAIHTAKTLQVPYVPRKKNSISLLQGEWDSGCLVVGKERIELYDKGSAQPFFFHPNSAMFRIKRLLQGDHDPFAEIAQLSKGMTVMDCTLGLSSDAIVASFLVGEEGKVIGIEGQKYLAFIVQKGLQSWNSGLESMNGAMKRIEVVHSSSLDYLKKQPNESVDCVYFDPMFENSILESDGIKALGQFAVYDDLTEEVLKEARRVAKTRIILKDHYKSTRFEKYGFQVVRRKTSKFHFGVIDK